MYCVFLASLGPKVNLISHFWTLKDFKHKVLWSPLAPLMGEIDLRARGLFRTNFNSKQLLLEASLDMTCIFGRDEFQSESNVPFLHIVRVLRRVKVNIMKNYRKFSLTRLQNFCKISQKFSIISQVFLNLIIFCKLKPGLPRNANRMQTQHSKMMRKFDVGVLLRWGKQHSVVRRTFGEQPNAIRRLSVHQRKFAYNTFTQGQFTASANAEQCTNVPYILPRLSSACVVCVQM